MSEFTAPSIRSASTQAGAAQQAPVLLSEDALPPLPQLREDEIVESDDEEDEDDGKVQLGFLYKEANALFSDPDWREWDGGKVGGKPVWLDPVNLPNASELMCGHCSDPLTFLLQIYCPVDVPQAFHRCLYVFCCKKKACIDSKQGVKVLRVQLPKDNEFYSTDPKTHCEFKEFSNAPKLCALCGCRGGNVCSGCKSVSYCSKAHQKLHWKSHKKVCAQGGAASEDDFDESQQSFLFPQYEIAVEPEEPEEDPEETSEKASPEIWEDAVTPGGEDEAGDAAITQAHYNKALSDQKYDPVYVAFLTRVDKGGTKQVLRYCEDSIRDQAVDDLDTATRDRGRIFLSSESKKAASSLVVPPCPLCNAPRTIEFQILPQLLHFLEVDKNTHCVKTIAEKTTEGGDVPQNVLVKGVIQNQNGDDLDWGIIDVYTCSQSCGSGTYCEEVHVLQDLPLSELQISQQLSN